MNKYKAFYNNKTCEVSAKSSYAAQNEAADKMRVPASKRYLVSVLLLELDGKPYTHNTGGL